MSVTIEQDRIAETKAFFGGQARALLYAGAQVAQDVAYSRSRWRTGRMADEITIIAEDTLMFVVAALAPYSVYHEYGTGIYATGPGGSRAKKIPWVYYDEYLGKWFTTYGVAPHPFMRPGYEAAKAWVLDNADKFFRGPG